jgi:cation-transporting ATPase I
VAAAAGSPAVADVLTVAAAACPDPAGQVPHATDRAVLAAAQAAGASVGSPGARLAELPFETGRGRASTLLGTPGGRRLAVKGAPEVVIENAALTSADRRAAYATADELARAGLRVLAVAAADDPSSVHDVRALRLIGFVGLADTPRPSARPGVRALLDAGLRVVVVTGDHPVTAVAIARDVGVPGADQVVTGAELDRLGEEGYAARVATAAVFARVSPEQKVRLVTTLQRLGHVVAMTGDGANDAAAIRAADVGVAIRGRCTDAATGAADLLLTDADVTRLADAVLAGRRMWRSVTDAVSVLVGGNAGEIAFTLLGTAVGGEAPLSPRQLLLVNLLTDMAPAMALAVRGRAARSVGGDLDRPAPPGSRSAGGPPGDGPGHPGGPGGPGGAGAGGGGGGPWLDGDLRRMLLVRGTATAAGATTAWLVGRCTGTAPRAATMGLLALVGTQLGQTITLAGRDPLVIGTALGSAAILAVLVQLPVLSGMFGCRPIGPVGWSVAAGCATGASAAAWMYERRRDARQPGAPVAAADAVTTPMYVPGWVAARWSSTSPPAHGTVSPSRSSGGVTSRNRAGNPPAPVGAAR